MSKMWGSKAGKPRSLKSVGVLKPSSLIEVYTSGGQCDFAEVFVQHVSLTL